MKNFTKFCLITCAVLGILGMALCVSAISLGVPLDVVETIIADEELGDEITDAQNAGSHLQNVEKEFLEIDRLQIEVGIDEVKICTHEGNQIQVKAENVTSNFQCEESGGKLKIKDNGQKIRFGIFTGRRQPKITIYLPQDLKLEELDLSVGVGSVETEKLEVEILKIDCGIGSVYFRGNVKKDGNIDCGIGEVKMDLDGSQKQYNYDLECGIGSIHIGNSYDSFIPGEKYIDNDAEKEFAISCGIGSVVIKFS